ncbi:hypothetical protein [Geothrix sp. 21YS21S-4]|uniref:hypothetical protein n=1 Tax=Geothrix sp. 21YS21S-4 TaxID=3068889 RepID=UPI0027B971FB|nr:hypothetical protein [Geothrix sp. 21YS21S-4]
MKKSTLTLVLAAAFIGLLSFACDKTSSISGQPAHSAVVSKLAGTWQNDLMTVKIDLLQGKYEGIAMGEKFDKKLTIVKEIGNAVEFTVGEGPDKAAITAQLQEDGSLILTKEGGIPLMMKRVG